MQHLRVGVAGVASCGAVSAGRCLASVAWYGTGPHHVCSKCDIAWETATPVNVPSPDRPLATGSTCGLVLHRPLQGAQQLCNIAQAPLVVLLRCLKDTKTR
eukprot:136694-Chlamydomonas_euryale.AAC.2